LGLVVGDAALDRLELQPAVVLRAGDRVELQAADVDLDDVAGFDWAEGHREPRRLGLAMSGSMVAFTGLLSRGAGALPRAGCIGQAASSSSSRSSSRAWTLRWPDSAGIRPRPAGGV